MTTACSLLIFAKAPQTGTVKTRLIPALGAQGATDLYQRMLRYALEQAVAANIGPIELWCAPDPQDDFFTHCAQEFKLSLHTQQGADLGEKMAHALSDALKRAPRAILIGSDCPALDAAYLQQADVVLRNHQVVIAPAEDGGYALIGAAGIAPDIFNDIAWSTAHVMAQTRKQLIAQKIIYAELPQVWDVDSADDLRRLAAWPGLSSALSTLKVL
jgi:rSAM/selenodomain-associated transferase 1